ncbi:hypothetical protein ACFCYN_25085 [Gottfriedia sp. NPDC056225]|uniref:hypothetical protein n=1 Tax=Gottfriedia sp. NPDC056225 TaxID=3345751 RepID=UPI0035DADCB9
MRKVHLINTNKRNNPNCEVEMLINQKCSAYFRDWHTYVEKIQTGDIVFLYSTEVGIIARGIATGIVEKADYQGHIDAECYMYLDRFERLKTPLTAAKIKEASGIDVVFGVTVFTFANYENGLKVWQHITKHNL